MKILTYISFSTALFLLFSCEEEIAFDRVDVEQYVVVNSSFTPRNAFDVQLDFSRSILDDFGGVVTYIEGAEVRVLTEEGAVLTFNDLGEGKYVSQTKPLENEVYTLEVKVNNYPLITARSRVPTQALVEGLTTTKIEQAGDTIVRVDFDILDSDDIDNYYIWEVLDHDPFDDNSNVTNIYQLLQNIGASESVQDNGTWSKLFLQGMDFDQSISFITAQNASAVVGNDSGGDTSTADENEESFLKVISATSDYYRYLLSLELFLNSRNLDNGGSSGSSIPIELHSNIKGGLGIFAGYNQQVHEFLPE